VVRGGTPVFVRRRGRGALCVDLGGLDTAGILEGDLFRRVDLTAAASRPFLLFDLGGPSVESLRAEFIMSPGSTHGDRVNA
jgi:hypothetical protein